MKKYLSIFLGMLLVLGFAGSAFAIHLDIPSDDSTPAVAAGTASITLSGEIRERYDFRHVSFNDNQSDFSFFDQRVRLGVAAKLSPNTSAFIQMETESGDTVNSAPDSVPWGTLTTNNTGISKSFSYGYAPASIQAGNAEMPGFSILNAWILHQGTGLLGVNAGFKIGHQPIILPNGLFLDHSYYGDDAIVAFVNPIKELELDAIYIKLRETPDVSLQSGGYNDSLNLSSSTNGYAFVAQYKPNKVTAMSADATYLEVQNLGQSVFSANPNGATFGSTSDTIATTLKPDAHLWNFGVRGNTEAAGFRFMIDGEFQSGYAVNLGTTTNNSGVVSGSTLNMAGYALKGQVGYTLEPVKLTLEAAYGSGNDGKSFTKDNTFITFQSPVPHMSYVYDYRTYNAAGADYGGLQNVQYIKLDANANVTKDLNVDFAVMQLQAAHAIKASLANLGGGLNYTIQTAGSHNLAGSMGSSNIGTELDYTLTYQIDKGLKIYAEGGYLFAGNFWNAAQQNSGDILSAGSTNGNENHNSAVSIKDAYTMREGIQLNF